MVCPYCSSETQVTNSRSRAKDTQVWRRRQCKSCRTIWTTREEIDLSTSHRVINDSGRLEPFSRDKLFESIKDATQHRKTSLSDATALTDTVLALILHQKTAHVPIELISSTVSGVLSNFDPTAAAVYSAKHSSQLE